jgi:enterochelin esterase-like enzyme
MPMVGKNGSARYDAAEEGTIRARRFPWSRRRRARGASVAVAPGPAESAPAPEEGPSADRDSVTFRLRDPRHDLAGVRLLQEVRIPGDLLDFARTRDGWALRLDRPPVRRMEYRFALRHPDGRTEEVCDPANPLRAPGAFGEKSVVEFPEYSRPPWLAAPGVPGATADLTVPSRLLHAEVQVRLWAPADARPDEPLPLLLAHDGPEYDAFASLTRFSAALIRSGRLPRHRVALLAPGDRNDWYSANVGYARALALAVLPALRRTVAVTGPVVGVGASLGALEMLHVQRRHAGVLGALFLQSGSFFDRRLDPQERRFARYTRVTRFVAGTLRGGVTTEPVPVTLTCGVVEENLGNNRQMAAALLARGYQSRLLVHPDAHNYVSWRDAFDPALADLLATVWA